MAQQDQNGSGPDGPLAPASAGNRDTEWSSAALTKNEQALLDRQRQMEAIAERIGMTVSPLWLPTAERAREYAETNAGRSSLPGETDVQIASRVRMLSRDHLDHEGVVCAARDRICALIVERDDLLEALQLILPLAKGYAPDGQTDAARRTCRGSMTPDPIAQAEADLARAQAEFAAYLRDQFVADFTRAVTLHAMASVAERQHQREAA
jgi:hypothetical protein